MRAYIEKLGVGMGKRLAGIIGGDLFISNVLIIIGSVIPYDGVPQEDLVTVALPVTIIFSTLNTGGIVYALICFLFNAIFHKKRYMRCNLPMNYTSECFTILPQAIVLFCYLRLIRLDSPNLNYLIIFGSCAIYMSCVLFVTPTLNPSVVSALCIVSYV